MKQNEIDEVKKLHKLWVDSDSQEGKRANLSWSDLRGSDLSKSNLSGSNLSGSDLRGSDLSKSDLSWSDLRRSNLSGSNLSGSDLSWSNLSGSNLSGSDLENTRINNCVGNMKEIKSMHLDTWIVAINTTTKEIAIGCEQHYIKDWMEFDDDKISEMDSDALEWWSKWKPILKQILAMDNLI